MPRYLGTENYDHASDDQLGVLLINLGTPDELTPAAVRRYLAEFLWDPRVIEMPRALWWLILHGFILRVRPRKSIEAYRQVWTEHGSPLLVISRQQRESIEKMLAASLPVPVPVALGMRYGNPSIGAALEELREKNVKRLLVLPLYPQYSATTTASSFDAVAEALTHWRWLPEIRFVTQYHDEAGYIGALSASVREYWASQGRGEHLVMSFHGLPRRYLLAGDPYHCQCQKTARLLAEALFLEQDEWSISFQSRVGREEWLKPYTEEHLQDLATGGRKKIDVVCPGFSVDCLETLEEIVIRYGESFVAAGGETLGYVPALNNRKDHINCLTQLIVRQVQGWAETSPAWNLESKMNEQRATARRAKSAGA
jgi:ferrochelatase